MAAVRFGVLVIAERFDPICQDWIVKLLLLPGSHGCTADVLNEGV